MFNLHIFKRNFILYVHNDILNKIGIKWVIITTFHGNLKTNTFLNKQFYFGFLIVFGETSNFISLENILFLVCKNILSINKSW